MDDNIASRQYSLDEVRPKDREEGYPKSTPNWVRRVLEIIPGVVTWIFILSPLLVSILGIPEVLVFYIGFLMVYWIYRGFRFLFGLIIGVVRMNRDMKRNWMKDIKKEYKEDFDEINYLYLTATYTETYETLKATLEYMRKLDVGAKKISIVYGIEERKKEVQIPVIKKLQKEYRKIFREFKYYVHPNNIVGEVYGVKGGSINWAARRFVEEIEGRGEKLENYLTIVVDSDWRPHAKFLSAITYKYFSTKDPKHKFYASAVHTFNNNLWKVPPLIRIHSVTTTLVVLHNWVVNKKNVETFSAYVANLKVIEETGFWCPDVPNDDTAFYWNALIRYGGNFYGEEVYVPTYNDAVENESILKTHQSLYKQQYRWGWGVVIFPITLAALIEAKQIPLPKRLHILNNLLENRLIFLTVVYILTLGLPLLNIFSPQYTYSSTSYNLPVLMSYLMTGLMLLNIPLIYYKRKITLPPKSWGFWRNIWDFIETALVTVNMLTFTFIPYIQANTELMFGRKNKKGFYITEKIPIKK